MVDVKVEIGKLLGIAEKAKNPEEAQKALLRARELLAKQQQEQSSVVHTVVESLSYKQHWKGDLGTVITENFRCYCYWLNRKNGPVDLVFMGLPTDVKVAARTYKAAVTIIERLVRKHLHEKKKASKLSVSEAMAARQSFIMGFIAGLQRKFEEQTSADDWGLTVKLPQVVDDALGKMQVRKAKPSKSRLGVDPASWAEGQREGERFTPVVSEVE